GGQGGARTRDVRSVVAHELGHVLGLMHPCEVGGLDGAPDCADQPELGSALMFPLYDPGRATLGSDDEEGLCYLYAGAACEITGCPADQQCTTRGCQTLCGGDQEL